MNSGFVTIKDVLDTLIIPLAILLIGRLIVFWNKRQKERQFIKLIFRETEEMKPIPEENVNEMEWCEHLKKKLIHEETFINSNSNLEFILSVDPDLVYFESQLWMNFLKAEETLKEFERMKEENKSVERDKYKTDIEGIAKEWNYFLKKLCLLLKTKYSGSWLSVKNPFTKKVNHVKKFDPYCHIYELWTKILPIAENLNVE